MEKKKRGRPPIGDKALTSLEHNRRYRERLKAMGSATIQIVLTKTVIEVADMFIMSDTPTRTSVIQGWIETFAADVALGDPDTCPTAYQQMLANRIASEATELFNLKSGNLKND